MNKKILLGTCIVTLVALVSSVSFALWYLTFQQTNKNLLATDCFKMNFIEDTSTNITLDRAYPMTEEEGSKLKPYLFSFENVCTSTISYQINLETTSESTMPERVMKVMLNNQTSKELNSSIETNTTIPNGKKAFKLESGTLYPNDKKNYEIRVWMNEITTMEDTDAMNKNFLAKVTVTGSYQNTYREAILNGTDPVLKDNLIPVTIANDGTVKKADITNEWYNYQNKTWANAIILEDENISYQNNEIIPETNIESYFVWIPRYKYQIFNDGNYPGLTTIENKTQEIKVIFENKNTAISNGNTVGSWLTHPAFTSFDTNGMWVGKYETGYKGAISTTEAQQNINDSSKLQIKPNVYSWRNIQVSNAHLNSYNYQRNLDSHMMKNIEKGAIGYLQHSKYGSNKNVRLNNNSSYITGYAAVNEPTCGYTGTNEECNKYEGTSLNADGVSTKRYNSTTGYLASTTGNISGIYDMSGGSWEFVMGVMLDKIGKPMSGRNSLNNSGFNGIFGCPTCGSDISGKTELITGINFPETKYYDTYAYAESENAFNRRILGDATGELGPFGEAIYKNQTRPINSWYSNEAWFVDAISPWFGYGQYYHGGLGAGINSFDNATGAVGSGNGYRLVLSF